MFDSVLASQAIVNVLAWTSVGSATSAEMRHDDNAVDP
jgi:hypothetical protein